MCGGEATCPFVAGADGTDRTGEDSFRADCGRGGVCPAIAGAASPAANASGVSAAATSAAMSTFLCAIVSALQLCLLEIRKLEIMQRCLSAQRWPFSVSSTDIQPDGFSKCARTRCCSSWRTISTTWTTVPISSSVITSSLRASFTDAARAQGCVMANMPGASLSAARARSRTSPCGCPALSLRAACSQPSSG